MFLILKGTDDYWTWIEKAVIVRFVLLQLFTASDAYTLQLTVT